MHEAERQVAAFAPGRTRGHARDRAHAVADHHPVAGDVPFEFTQTGGVEGQFDPALVQSRAPFGVDRLRIVGEHLAGQRGQVRKGQAFGFRVGLVGLGVADRQHPDRLAARRQQRRAGIEADVNLAEALQISLEQRIGADVAADDDLWIAHHEVGETTGPRVLSGGHAEARLVPEAILVDEHDGGARRVQDQRRHPGNPVETSVRAAVECMKGTQRLEPRGFIHSGGQ
jgi:hypothetical protein